jgi:glycosyltransferase involved in cell wall biosynthesis
VSAVRRIAAVAVVVPARDEELLLPGCLDAISVAAQRVQVPVTVVVALDRCTDGTADVVAARPGVIAAEADAGVVGTARAAGVGTALSHLAEHPVDDVWIACTDADSRVPADWLEHQLQLADDGVDLVLGTVDLLGDELPPGAAARWWRDYGRLVEDASHSHVHGANVGVRASTYVAAGGFAPVSAHEDVLLARAIAQLPGATVVPSVAVPVATSDRLRGRAPEGVSADLRRLAGPGLESTA